MDSIGGVQPFNYSSCVRPKPTATSAEESSSGISDGFSKTAGLNTELPSKTNVMQFLGASGKNSELSSVNEKSFVAPLKFDFPLNGLNSKEFFYIGV